MQVIGIIGDDHCGSTVLARAMASLPGIYSGGELHWLIDMHPGNVQTVRAGWAVTRDCVVHGPSCSVFSPAFLQQTFTDETLYSSLSNHIAAMDYNAKYLVASDKYPDFYKKFSKPKSMLGIVFYKSPVLAYYSQTRTNKRPQTEALDPWVNIYSQALYWADKFCQRVAWVDYTAFALQPEHVFKRLVDVLKLETTLPEKIRMATDYHFIGGNFKVHKATTIAMDSSYANLSKQEMNEVYAREKVKSIMTELTKKSRAQDLVPFV